MSSPTQQPSARPGCLTYLLFSAASIWIVVVTYVGYTVAWLADQALLIQDTPLPWFGWPLISWGHALLLAAPVMLLAVFTRAPRFRAAYQTWAWSLAFVAVLALARVFPVGATQPAALAQIVLSVVCAVVLIGVAHRQRRALGRAHGMATLLAAALVPLVVFPLLIWGALGSPLDSALDLLAALSLGTFVGVLFDSFLFQPLTAHASTPGWDIAFGGFVAGIAFVILGAGFGFGGSQLLLLVMLPPLGFAVAGLKRCAPRDADGAWSPLAWFIGLCAAAPLMFVDPDELTLLLGNDEILTWAFMAAALSLVGAGIVGAALWLLRQRVSGAPRVGVAASAFAVTWSGALLLFLFAGRPGFTGEQLFVILRAQADVSAAATLTDRNARSRFVYLTLTQHANQTQANLRATLDRFGIAYKAYYLVNGIEVNGGPIVRAYLMAQPEVERVLDSPHLRPLPAPVPVSTGDQSAPTQPQWNITMIGADRVWSELGVTGKGIVVGQSDSGVDGDHPALRDGYRGRAGQNDYNWLDPWNHTHAPTDSGGHGTHTLGSALGRGNIGVAPDAEWFACVNLARNLGNPPVYLDCMQFMLAPYPQNGDPLKDGDPTKAAHVIN
ncbi:MAG: S8 family serine peptidase, partial [Chloroflexota bacterium]